MRHIKNSERAAVDVRGDGTVLKHYRGSLAMERMMNEVRVLTHLESHGCTNVPRVLRVSFTDLTIEISNCGMPVDWLSEDRLHELFGSLEHYGIRHMDPALRNVMYEPRTGRFHLIDFEFATLLESGRGLKPTDTADSIDGMDRAFYSNPAHCLELVS